MKAISFDLWGTLIVSNPVFKTKQAELAREFSGMPIEEFISMKNHAKKVIDDKVETTGNHLDRREFYRALLLNPSNKAIDEFIEYSDQLFLTHKPLIREEETNIVQALRDKGYKIYISSNTVFIYGDVLNKIVYDYFGIIKSNCKFSDEVGVSKPNPKMFDFHIKPTWHIGDNIITDGSCEQLGIKHYHINQKQNFQTFLQNENI